MNRSRITPLPKKGTRTIRVSYIEELEVDRASSKALYKLPLNFPSPVPKFTLKVCVINYRIGLKSFQQTQYDVSESGIPVLDSDFSVQPVELNKMVDANTVKSETRSKVAASKQRYGRYFEGKNQPIKKGVYITVPSFR